jgi:hypothetical protein
MSDVSVTNTAVKAANSDTVIAHGIAGATITAGDVVYADASDNYEIKPAIATNAAQADSVVGIALNDASADQPVAYATAGDVTFNSGAFVVGAVYVLSGENDGGIAPTADLDSSSNTNYATILGVSTSATNLRLSLKASGVKNPA